MARPTRKDTTMTTRIASDEAHGLYIALLDKVTEYGIAQHTAGMPPLGEDRLTLIRAANQAYREVIEAAGKLRDLTTKEA